MGGGAEGLCESYGQTRSKTVSMIGFPHITEKIPSQHIGHTQRHYIFLEEKI
jgi:hypothetical protein